MNSREDLWQQEFLDFMKVLEMGAKKYAPNGWLDKDGHGTSHKEMHASIFRHLAASSSGVIKDEESNLDHLLHVATRALMLYTRRQRGIVNSKDEQNPEVSTYKAYSYYNSGDWEVL